MARPEKKKFVSESNPSPLMPDAREIVLDSRTVPGFSIYDVEVEDTDAVVMWRGNVRAQTKQEAISRVKNSFTFTAKRR